MERAAIVYLIRTAEENVREIQDSLTLLKRNFLDSFPYPVLIFKEPDFPIHWQAEIEATYEGVEFCTITFGVPDHNKNLDIPDFFPHPTHGSGPIAWGHPGFDLGYRHMCRFMSGTIFMQEFLNKYDWYLRLDTDSFILAPISFDPFEKMARENKIYGYNNIQDDNPKVVVGLYEKSAGYFSELGITPKNQVDHPKMFYTNFEICKLDWFRGDTYQNYFRFLDSLGGFYTQRWGDAPVRYIAVKTLLSNENIQDFHGLIQYKHGCHRDFEKLLTYQQ